MVITPLLFQIALIIIIARCGYVAFNLLNGSRKSWLDILYYLSIVIVALSFLL
jgi:hypothetical protein